MQDKSFLENYFIKFLILAAVAMQISSFTEIKKISTFIYDFTKCQDETESSKKIRKFFFYQHTKFSKEVCEDTNKISFVKIKKQKSSKL